MKPVVLFLSEITNPDAQIVGVQHELDITGLRTAYFKTTRMDDDSFSNLLESVKKGEGAKLGEFVLGLG